MLCRYPKNLKWCVCWVIKGSLYENEKRVAFGLRPLPELAGVEMVSTIVYQLTKDLTEGWRFKSLDLTHLFCRSYNRCLSGRCQWNAISASTFSVAGDALTDLVLKI